MIDLKDISRIYQVGSERVYALNKANLHIDDGEFVSIIGPSGPLRTTRKTNWRRSGTKKSASSSRAST